MSLEYVRTTKPKPRFMIATDLDHTLVQNEDKTHTHLLRFNTVWGRYFAGDSLLVYSTGRSPVLFERLWGETPLLLPDIMICSVGSEIFYRNEQNQFEPDKSWTAHLDKGWDSTKVVEIAAAFPELVLQADSEQRPHKSSYLLQGKKGEEAEEVLGQLRAKLLEAGIDAKVVYSGGVDVDILSAQAGKGFALAFLMKQLEQAGIAPSEGVQVNGDSGNDVELFQVEGVRGCVVANAHPELDAFYRNNPSPSIFKSTSPCSGGILEAMLHFGTLPTTHLDSPLTTTLRAALHAAASLPLLLPPSTNLAPANVPPPSTPLSTFITPATPAPVFLPQVEISPTTVIPLGFPKDGPAPAAGAAPSGVTNGEGKPPASSWIDRIVAQQVAEGVWVAVYQMLFLGADGLRDTKSALACSALLVEGGEGKWVLKHLHASTIPDGSDSLKPVFVSGGSS